jgi:hypothetical protein
MIREGRQAQSHEAIQALFRESTRELFPQLANLSDEELDAHNDRVMHELAEHPPTEEERRERLTEIGIRMGITASDAERQPD